MATNKHATTEELLEAVFSVTRAEATVTQRRGKHISAATLKTTTVEDLCFLRGPRQGVINGAKFRAELAKSLSLKRRLGGWCEIATSLGVCRLKHRENCMGVCEKKT
jgi:hypothetical protein